MSQVRVLDEELRVGGGGGDVCAIFSDGWLASRVWECSRVLCAVLRQLRLIPGDAPSAVELGAGVGSCGAFLARRHRGARVAVTDLQEAMEGLAAAEGVHPIRLRWCP